MGISPTSPDGSPIPRTEPNLILVGLPGAGKSTVGRALATRLGRPFLDFDREIERREAATIARIFDLQGEAYFRSLERELSRELTGTAGMVLAPGGGWIMDPQAVALLRPPGRIIYLRVTPEAALQRLGRDAVARPLLRVPDPLGSLRLLLAQRGPHYSAADIVVEAEDIGVQEVTDMVVQLASRLLRG